MAGPGPTKSKAVGLPWRTELNRRPARGRSPPSSWKANWSRRPRTPPSRFTSSAARRIPSTYAFVQRLAPMWGDISATTSSTMGRPLELGAAGRLGDPTEAGDRVLVGARGDPVQEATNTAIETSNNHRTRRIAILETIDAPRRRGVRAEAAETG